MNKTPTKLKKKKTKKKKKIRRQPLNQQHSTKTLGGAGFFIIVESCSRMTLFMLGIQQAFFLSP